MFFRTDQNADTHVSRNERGRARIAMVARRSSQLDARRRRPLSRDWPQDLVDRIENEAGSRFAIERVSFSFLFVSFFFDDVANTGLHVG